MSELVYLLGLKYRNWCTYMSELVYLLAVKALLYKRFKQLKNI
ncbi:MULTISPECIES: hypothetical protein [unclassified Acinetobacter]|nr:MULTISPECIES: hypothetical protein [unclassified Acinetobacter]